MAEGRWVADAQPVGNTRPTTMRQVFAEAVGFWAFWSAIVGLAVHSYIVFFSVWVGLVGITLVAELLGLSVHRRRTRRP